MKIENTYEDHSCLSDLELLALTTDVEFDTIEYLAAYEQIHRDCRRCTPCRESERRAS